MRRIAAGVGTAIWLLGVTVCSAAGEGEAEPRLEPAGADRVDAMPVSGPSPIDLDGWLEEPVWESVPLIDAFVQREPREGAVPAYRTEARVAFDPLSLYVAVRAFDPEPEALVGILTRRDEPSPSDWIRVVVDSYHDRRTAYEFAVNPAGVKQDAYRFNDGDEDKSWDAIWDVGVAIDERGWTAEFRIPFSQLRFDPAGDGTIGFALVRQVGRLNETSTWPLLPRSASGYVSSFGQLGGLSVASAPRRLELAPYVVADLTARPPEPGNPLVAATELGGTPGLDLKLALTPGLTLTGTLNPDFGQVEADPADVNLSAFETFFPERRPFFVEGAGVFRFDIDCNDGRCTGLFYSRRVGRAPQGEVDAPEDGYASAPAQTTILGAAKLTGRVGGFSLGALNAWTSAEHASIADGSLRFAQEVEPFTGYSVVRLRREFSDRSSFGFMTTATNRRVTDGTQFLAGEAYTGGLDGDWRLGDRFGLEGYWAGSTVRGSVDAIAELQENNRHSFQRPDADHITFDPTRTSLNGHSGQLSFSKIAGERVRFNTNARFKSPGFEINDLGFVQRADLVNTGNWLQWRHDTPSKYLRSFRVNFNYWRGWDFGGDRLNGGGNVNAHAVFANNWRTGVGFSANLAGFDDRMTRGGPGGRTNPRRGVWHYLNGDDRRPLFAGYSMNWSRDAHGSSRLSLNPDATVRPTAALSLTAGLKLSRTIDDSHWVEQVTTDKNHYVLGRLDQTTVSVTTRLGYTLSPNLSLQLYAEPFVSTGDYSGFKELVDGRAEEYADRFAPFAFDGDPDFNVKSLRTTNVLRWEYRPGSTLFVVWQQAREDRLEGEEAFDSPQGLRDVFSVPATNVLLVKLAYWLDF